MFVLVVGVMNFGQVKKKRLIAVKIFWSNFKQFLVILIWSGELASSFPRNILLFKYYIFKATSLNFWLGEQVKSCFKYASLGGDYTRSGYH